MIRRGDVPGAMSADRYSRQTALPDVGEEGQERLRRATVGVVGVGGLGSPVALYLAAAGVGRLVLIDPETPELSNLNRQVLHWTEDVGVNTKVRSAASKLRRLNPEVEVEDRAVRLTAENVDDLLPYCDVVVDCLDSFPPRMVLNRFCVERGTPLVHGAVEGWHGQVTVVLPGRTPCLACLFPRSPEPRSVPIMGATAGAFGSIQAGEAIKLLTGTGEVLASRLLIGDLQHHQWDVVDIAPAGRCQVCGEKR